MISRLHNLALGAVTHQQQVEDAGEGDADVVGGQLVLQAPAQTLQGLYFLFPDKIAPSIALRIINARVTDLDVKD